MHAWRLSLLVLLFLFLGVPLALPVLEAVLPSSGSWENWQLVRLLTLTRNSVLLITGTLFISLPVGTLVAFLLFRTDLPGRNFFALLVFITLFIPLPVLVSAWHATLSTGTWLPFFLWQPRPGQPWTEGLLPAIWVHAQAALPWVILIIGQNFLCSERELEEFGLLHGNRFRVFCAVILPRSVPALVIAGLWVSVQTAGEISVTDMFQVRTLAEEVYLVFSEAGQEALPRAVFSSLPPVILFGFLVLVVISRLEKKYPPLLSFSRLSLCFGLRRWRWPAGFLVSLFFILFAGIPLMSLFWRAGIHDYPPVWSLSFFLNGLSDSWLINGTIIYSSLIWAFLGALLATTMALWICWCLRERKKGLFFWQIIIGFLLIGAAIIPGPVAGLGLKKTIQYLVFVFPHSVIADWLYYQPSPLPLIWAYFIRCLPFAFVVLWPNIRIFPQELLDEAYLDGVAPFQRLTKIMVPFFSLPLIMALFITMSLALGEISISKLATTPGMETFTLLIFDRMHYGVEQVVAALCLVLILVLCLAGIEIAIRKKCLTANSPPR